SQVNTALCELTGLTRERLEILNVEELAHEGDRELVRAGLRPLLERSRGRWQGEIRIVDGGKQELPIDLGITLLREGDEAPFLLLHAQDLRERRRAQERMTFLVDHDSLTGLPARSRLEAELEVAADGAVVVLDLDGLRSLNDSLGRSAGDALLA